MLEDGRGKEQPAALEVDKHRLVRVLAEHTRPLGLFGHFALGVHKLDKRQVVLLADLGVVFTERGRDVNHAGTVGQRDIGVADDIVCLFALRGDDVARKVEERLIFLALEVGAAEMLQHFVIACAEHRVGEGGGEVIGIAVVGLDLDIVVVGVDAERDVGGQRPGRSRPCEDIGVLANHLEAGDCRALLDILIALRNLVRGQRRTAARAVGYDLEALVEQAAVVNLLERPPLGLDEGVFIGDIGVLHVRPKADGLREILPHALVLPDALLAVLDERLKPIGLNLILAVDAEHLLDLELDRQTVRVPARLAGDIVALHGLVARDHIFDDAREDMPDMRLAVCRRGAVIKGEGLAACAVLLALLKNVILLPKAPHILLAADKGEVGGYFLIHL